MSEDLLLLDRLIARRFLHIGDVVIDAGAYNGDTARMYRDMGASRVIAFEPYPHKSLWESGGEVYPVALGGYEGKVPLLLSDAHDRGNTTNQHIVEMFPDVFSDPPRSVPVIQRSIDSLVYDGSIPPHTDFWKLDIEGAELQALCGARQTILHAPPRVIQVESYRDYIEGICLSLMHYYRHGARVCPTVDGALGLLPLFARPEEGAYLPAPPTYVFWNDGFA